MTAPAAGPGFALLDLPFGTTTLVDLLADAPLPPSFAEGAEVRIGRVAGDGIWLVRPGTPPEAALVRRRDVRPGLPRALDNPWPRLAVVAMRTGDRGLVLRVHQFIFAQPWPAGEGITLGVNGAELKRALPSLDFAAGCETLASDLALAPAAADEPVRLFLSAGDQAVTHRRFRLHGPRMTAEIRARDEGALQVTRILRGPSAPDGRLTLLELGSLSFVPDNAAPAPGPLARTMLEQLFSGTQRYLSLWTRYNDLDLERLNEEAQAVGGLPYSNWTRAGGSKTSLRFLLADIAPDSDVAGGLSALREQASRDPVNLEAGEQLPDFMLGADAPATGRPNQASRGWLGQCQARDIDAAGRWIEVAAREDETMADPPRRGLLFLSEVGSRAAMNRRLRAQEAVRSGRCPMPQLGLLLENLPLAMHANVPPTTTHVTPYVLRTMFNSPPDKGPTPLQERAINIALNTPDIAIIQGPPGTGKTKVITAIMKRIEELADPGDDPVGLFLITSFQHVAVDNVAAKVRPFGLPPFKKGKGSKTSEQDRQRSDAAAKWIAALGARLRSRPDHAAEAGALKTLRMLQTEVQAYALGLHRLEETAAMLEALARAVTGLVPMALQDRLRRLVGTLRQQDVSDRRGPTPERRRAYAAAYALRYQPETYADDGRLVIRKLLQALGEASEGTAAAPLLDAAGRELLEAMRAGAPPTPENLSALARLREVLLAALTPERRPFAVRSGPREDVGVLLADLVTAVRQRVEASHAGIPLVLDDYLLDLEQSRWRLEDSLEHYTAATAETCQGSARTLGAALQQNRVARGYETVIVDEAARANPLDLLIPMAQARRRIILVGDHLQLPHTLESKLEKEVNENFDAAERRMLDMSLFERLFTELKRREVENGEPARVVRLDTQFRMPALLGDFVSAHFYDGTLLSPPASPGRHGISCFSRDGVDHAAVFIDVPAPGEREGEARGRKSRSYSRELEAEAIVRTIDRILMDKTGVAIGVISFYADQVALLRAKLEPIQQRQAAAKGPLVEVGSVDAFQGKEYPIVFLSMTRSNDFKIDPRPAGVPSEAEIETRGKQVRGRYGHLVVRNRLCVALSRQQEVLVVVGDGAMLRAPEATEFIAPLVAFERLCRDKGLCLQWHQRQLRPAVQTG